MSEQFSHYARTARVLEILAMQSPTPRTTAFTESGAWLSGPEGGAVSSSPRPCRRSQLTWQTICGAVKRPHSGLRSGAKRAIRSRMASRVVGSKSEGIASLLLEARSSLTDCAQAAGDSPAGARLLDAVRAPPGAQHSGSPRAITARQLQALVRRPLQTVLLAYEGK